MPPITEALRNVRSYYLQGLYDGVTMTLDQLESAIDRGEDLHEWIADVRARHAEHREAA